jgi:DNA adenine methylase
MRNSPICWTGGKRLLRRDVLKRFPNHVTYVEVFGGAGWVLFGKDPKLSSVEVINDLHGELTNFYRCVREKPLELIEKLRFRLVSQEDFRRLKASDMSDRTEIERAAAFFWMLKNAFGGKARSNASFGYSVASGSRLSTERIETIIQSAHERLSGVYVFGEDFERLISRLDRAETFFYCDPPYYDCPNCYEHEFGIEDHKRLAATLKRINGKFLLSYGDHMEIRQLYGWATIEEVSTRYSLARDATKRGRVTELLIRNY